MDPISERRDPISERRDPISECRDPISECRDPISEYRDPISECREMSAVTRSVSPHASVRRGTCMGARPVPAWGPEVGRPGPARIQLGLYGPGRNG